MSFDDYAEYMIQKYRLSTAIAILRTKPENLTTTEQYMNELKNKMNLTMDDDLDVTIHSDDFNLDDEPMISDENDLMNISETILKDYNFENDDEIDVCNEKSGDQTAVRWTQSSTPHFPDNLSQSTYWESQTPNPTPIVTHSHNPVIEQAIDNDATYCDTPDIENSIPRYIVEAPITTDSQKTILYSIYGGTQNTHFSPSQSNIIIPKGLYGVNDNITVSDGVAINNRTDRIQNSNCCINKIPNMNELDAINDNERILIENALEDGGIIKKTNENLNGTANIWSPLKYASEGYVKNNDDEIKLTNVTDKSQVMNHRSVVRDDDQRSNQIVSGNRQTAKLYSKNGDENPNTLAVTEHNQISQNLNIFAQNFDEYYTGNVFNVGSSNQTIINADNTESNNPSINIVVNSIGTFNLAPKVALTHVENNEIIISNSKINEISETMPNITEPSFEKSQHTYIFSQNDEILNENNDDNDTSLNAMTSTTQDGELDKEIRENKQIIRLAEEDNEEVIPFKILEELNKVKGFLNRNERRISTDGYSTDSGYRSDSQGRKNALQLSGSWINQSGHCLFNYIMSCHLVVTTRDITNEIAEVLGQLVDKLHEEEKYPSFLEALLEANNLLLTQIHEGENGVENVMLSKDENIQRIVLLNKSVHIQKYCIEKIANILNEYHAKLTDTNSILELTNINQIENLHYLFHLLEILLQKYNKNKDVLSQASTQTSQDDGIFKKSSITDLWKRKWNPNYQDGGNAGSCEKTCVLQVCCEILNKIIVDSLKSYSLVSYAALRCFNLTQS